MKLKKFFTLILFFYFFSVIYQSCQINEPALPSWDIDLSVPFTNKSYTILDILDRSSNIGFDSLNNNLVYLFGESNYIRDFGEDIRFDGLKTTEVIAPSTLQLDTFLVIEDSTFIRRAEFLNGTLSFTFFNASGQDYSFNLTLKNLFSVSGNDTARISGNVASGKSKSLELNMSEYYISNEIASNDLKLRLGFDSELPVPVRFNYTLSEYSIKSLEGKLKPVDVGTSYEEVIDPFGSDVPEGELKFASITPNKNFIIVKKYSEIYQIDFTNISIIGENKNGHRVRLKYLKNGNDGDGIDSVFSLTLPAAKDTFTYAINENNSNILEFINNIPKKIELVRNDFINKSYEEGSVKFTDSLTFKLMIQVPLDVSITKPIVFSDTVDAGIDDQAQRNSIDEAKNLEFTFRTTNALPLKTVGKILLLDSSFNPLLAISRIVGNQPDSTLTANAAPIGLDGFVNNHNVTLFSAQLDSTMIQKLKHMGKIIYEYKLYTDPNLIPPPLTSIKVRAGDFVRGTAFGKVKYRIDP